LLAVFIKVSMGLLWTAHVKDRFAKAYQEDGPPACTPTTPSIPDHPIPMRGSEVADRPLIGGSPATVLRPGSG
jgi:hypothetical protein